MLFNHNCTWVAALLVLLACAPHGQAATLPASASAPPCAALPDDAVAGGGLYIGEVHGTQEVPALVLCLALQALTVTAGPVIVSLEMPAEAASPEAAFWQGQDGRASHAMRLLVTELQAVSAANPRLLVRFHGDCRLTSADNVETAINACYGNTLASQAKDGFLIAYGGNYHAGRQTEPVRTAAVFLPPSIKTVNVLAAEPGGFWNYGPQTWPGAGALKPVSGFMAADGQAFDYIYVVPAFSLSEPAT